MGTRLRSLKLGEAKDPAVNGVIQFSKDGFGDTQMFGLIEPYLLEMMRIRTGHLNACTY